MKKTLTVLCLMTTLAGAGQTDSITFHPLGRFSIDTTIQPKYDTLPIIYLYADTAGVRNTYDTLANGWIRINELGVFWDFGYEVIEGPQIWRIGNDGSQTPLFNHITYLDRQKNPIRKSMIIWQTKTISNGTKK